MRIWSNTGSLLSKYNYIIIYIYFYKIRGKAGIEFGSTHNPKLTFTTFPLFTASRSIFWILLGSCTSRSVELQENSSSVAVHTKIPNPITWPSCYPWMNKGLYICTGFQLNPLVTKYFMESMRVASYTGFV